MWCKTDQTKQWGCFISLSLAYEEQLQSSDPQKGISVADSFKMSFGKQDKQMLSVSIVTNFKSMNNTDKPKIVFNWTPMALF